MTKSKAGGRPPRWWAPLSTNMLLDDEVAELSDAAFRILVMGILKATAEGTDGTFTSVPRRVARFSHVDASVVPGAIEELVDAEILVPCDDEFAFRSWAKYQASAEADERVESPRAVAGRANAFKRAHSEGKHDGDPKDGCPLCVTESVVVDEDLLFEDVIVVPEAGQVIVASTPPSESNLFAELASAPAKPLTTKALSEEFASCFDEVLANYDGSRVDAYRFLIRQADDLAAEHSGLSANVQGALRNRVLSHAVDFFRDAAQDGQVYAGLARVAKTWDDGYDWVIWALSEVAAAEFDSAQHFIAYIRKVAGARRSQVLGAAA